MAKTREFFLRSKNDVSLEDAVKAAEYAINGIRIIDNYEDNRKKANKILLYCEAPTSVYETLFGTTKKPKLPKSLEQYFESVGSAGTPRRIC